MEIRTDRIKMQSGHNRKSKKCHLLSLKKKEDDSNFTNSSNFLGPEKLEAKVNAYTKWRVPHEGMIAPLTLDAYEPFKYMSVSPNNNYKKTTKKNTRRFRRDHELDTTSNEMNRKGNIDNIELPDLMATRNYAVISDEHRETHSRVLTKLTLHRNFKNSQKESRKRRLEKGKIEAMMEAQKEANLLRVRMHAVRMEEIAQRKEKTRKILDEEMRKREAKAKQKDLERRIKQEKRRIKKEKERQEAERERIRKRKAEARKRVELMRKFAATEIQKMILAKLARRKVEMIRLKLEKEKQIRNSAATRIQKVCRGKLGKKKVIARRREKKLQEKRRINAIKIQNKICIQKAFLNLILYNVVTHIIVSAKFFSWQNPF